MTNQEFNTPEARVGMALFDLRQAINAIQELRLANDTADLVLADHAEIRTCAEWLGNLSDDIRKAVFKDAAE